MKHRIAALRGLIARHRADSFVSLDPPVNEYLTGFHGSASAVVVAPRSAALLCDFRYTEQAMAQARGCRVREVAGDLETAAGAALAEAGCALALFEPDRISVATHGRLRAAFTGGRLRAAPGLTDPLRAVKDADEAARMRRATDIAEAALSAVLRRLKKGDTERAVAAMLEHEFRKRGAQKASFDTTVLFGAHSSLPHGKPGDTPLKRGDIVLVDCGCVVDGYCSDLTRTAVFGSIPGAWFEDIYACVLEAQLAGLAAVRPGAGAAAVDRACRDVIERAGHGARFGHGTGHGVGLEIHEFPRLNQHSTTVLAPGMAVTVEPGIYLPGRGGVRIEDLVVVTPQGCDVLNKLPKELQVIRP